MATKYPVIAIRDVPLYRQQYEASGIRVALGYHVTSQNYLDSIQNVGFKPSHNGYDWLGDGSYFWEEDLDRAADWAEQRFHSERAVIGVLVRLNNCMDLPRNRKKWLGALQATYAEVRNLHRRNKIRLPHQSRGAHRLDCLVFNRTIENLANQGINIQSVREIFTEGRPAWWRSGIHAQSHIQIAIRDDSVIEAIWILETPEEFEEADRIL